MLIVQGPEDDPELFGDLSRKEEGFARPNFDQEDSKDTEHTHSQDEEKSSKVLTIIFFTNVKIIKHELRINITVEKFSNYLGLSPSRGWRQLAGGRARP